ncbi:hypothetical protein FOXB_05100 [Fusarium oxysporum f. sp. conglutinans Fo5176]|uniref:Uncharacterized protein n=1 Tax=Fusarium oxysporum (strain Fo5176) TaxID=660025 RepID=F9FFC1_FUSOF|nr:hypothetical protein FOXB_05100 [Fusarium oxysporum f. sp. conglutinans Fo5176]
MNKAKQAADPEETPSHR